MAWKICINVTSSDFNAVAGPNSHPFRDDVEETRTFNAPVQMHQGPNIRYVVRIDGHALHELSILHRPQRLIWGQKTDDPSRTR